MNNIDANLKILITGAAGFIGFHLSTLLLNKSYQVIGVDNLNKYYDPKLKENRLKNLKQYNNFTFYRVDLKDKSSVDDIFSTHKPEYVINLAAQAGVRLALLRAGGPDGDRRTNG